MYLNLERLQLCTAPEGSTETASSSVDAVGAVPPSAAPMPLHLRLTRRMEQAVTLFSILLQLALYTRSATTLTLQQHMQQAMLLALRGVCLMVATYLPTHSWLKYR